MNWNDHSKLKGTHAAFSASQYHWLGYDEEKAIDRYFKRFIPELGTVVHEYASQRIKNKLKMSKGDKNALINYILENNIPSEVINIQKLLDNLIPYVNDAISLRMDSEVVLKYSDLFYGTADAISFKNDKLQIHDLKTGDIPAHEDQLYIYAALFCLEYRKKPSEIKIECRIYQNNEVSIFEPEIEEITYIMDKIITFNKLFINMEDN